MSLLTTVLMILGIGLGVIFVLGVFGTLIALVIMWWKVRKIKKNIPDDIIETIDEYHNDYKEVENARAKQLDRKRNGFKHAEKFGTGRTESGEQVSGGERAVERDVGNRESKEQVIERTRVPIPEASSDGEEQPIDRSTEPVEGESKPTFKRHIPSGL